MDIELEGEATQEMGQNDDHSHYLSLDVKCPTTHKNTPKGNEIGEPSATIIPKEKQIWKNCNMYSITCNDIKETHVNIVSDQHN
jgi:hypothetical protein